MFAFKKEYVFVSCLLLFILLNEQCQTDYKRNTQRKQNIDMQHKLDSMRQALDTCNTASKNSPL